MIHTTILFETTDIYFHHIIESGLVKKKKKKNVYTFKRNKEVQIQLQAKSEILRNSGTQIPAVG